jgi:hypothetical protein
MKWGIVITPVEGEYYNKLCHFYKETNNGKEADPKSVKNSAHQFGSHLSLSSVLNYSPDIIRALQVTLYEAVNKLTQEQPCSVEEIQATTGKNEKAARIKGKNSFLAQLSRQLENKRKQQLKAAESQKPFCPKSQLRLANFDLKAKEKKSVLKENSVQPVILNKVKNQLLYPGGEKDIQAMKWRLMTSRGWQDASPLPATDQKTWIFVHHAQKRTVLLSFNIGKGGTTRAKQKAVDLDKIRDNIAQFSQGTLSDILLFQAVDKRASLSNKIDIPQKMSQNLKAIEPSDKGVSTYVEAIKRGKANNLKRSQQ